MIAQDEYRALGFQTISQDAVTASSLTVPAGARLALITTETAAARWRDDGTNPTAAVGYPLPIGSELRYDGSLATLKLIAQTGTAAITIAYYG